MTTRSRSSVIFSILMTDRSMTAVMTDDRGHIFTGHDDRGHCPTLVTTNKHNTHDSLKSSHLGVN
jgi:hypothetical protein